MLAVAAFLLYEVFGISVHKFKTPKIRFYIHTIKTVYHKAKKISITNPDNLYIFYKTNLDFDFDIAYNQKAGTKFFEKGQRRQAND